MTPLPVSQVIKEVDLTEHQQPEVQDKRQKKVFIAAPAPDPMNLGAGGFDFRPLIYGHDVGMTQNARCVLGSERETFSEHKQLYMRICIGVLFAVCAP